MAATSKAHGRQHSRRAARYKYKTDVKSWSIAKERAIKRHKSRIAKRLAKIQARMERLGRKFVPRGTARRLRREKEGLRERWLKNKDVPEVGT